MLSVSRPQFIIVLAAVIFTSCGRKSALQEASGAVQVQIGLQTSNTEYALQNVSLNGITNLKEVSGSYAKFFLSPGSQNDQLVGSAPIANFIRTGSFFVPTDLLSMQMATIYYHMQNLAAFDAIVGAGAVNQWPRAVGLETQIIDNNQARRNNAFYNGQTDSMMFVPFTGQDLPIAMNAGIIAHEHFHSLFYKIVLRPAIQNKKILAKVTSIHSDEDIKIRAQSLSKMTSSELSEKEKAQLFNETYLRGINEGLADYWGWLYTSDAEFMRWSLPTFQQERSLNLSENRKGSFETNADINYMIEVMSQSTDNARVNLANYAYTVGTPYARFLKQLTTMQSENKKISLAEAKNKTAQLVFKYIQALNTQFTDLKENEKLSSGDFFNFVALQMQAGESGLVLDQKTCEFLSKYINREIAEDKKVKVCEPLVLVENKR